MRKLTLALICSISLSALSLRAGDDPAVVFHQIIMTDALTTGAEVCVRGPFYGVVERLWADDTNTYGLPVLKDLVIESKAKPTVTKRGDVWEIRFTP